jgi:DNA-binding NarL/FixJ family response regulator
MNRTVLVLTEDLFWRTKIDHALKSSQTPGVFLDSPAEIEKRADPTRVGLLIVDLALKQDPIPAIAALKKAPKTRSIWVVGYCEHKQLELIERAKKAGADQVLPRSTFSQNLGDIILKYALPGSVRQEAEEVELPEE